MTNSEVSLKVFFSGVWRSQSVNDQLLQQISNQNIKKRKKLKGSPAVVKLSDERLDIVVLDNKGAVTRTDQVPLQDVVQLIANKYAAKCIFAIVRDDINKQFYIFAFHCASDRDAGLLIQGYGRVKQRLSGEGFNTDIKPAGTNWTLVQKQEEESDKPKNGHVSFIQQEPTENGEVRVISTERVEGETRIVTTGETTLREHIEGGQTSEKMAATDVEVKDELHHLADEIRDIRMFLKKSQGRQKFEKHYRYLNQNGEDDEQRLITTAHSGSLSQHPQRYVVVEQRPVENDVKYRLGSTTVRPATETLKTTVVQPAVQTQQLRRTVVQPAPHAQQYRQTIVQQPPHVQQYRQTIVQQAPQVQQYRQTVVQQVPQVKQYRQTVVQPVSHVSQHRTTTLHRAPLIHHYKGSRSSSLSGHSKQHVYASPNPALESKVYVKHQQPKKVVAKNAEIALKDKAGPYVLVVQSPTDKVTKRIENVYRNRSYRIHGRPHSNEYVKVAPQPRSVIVTQQAEDEKVKQYIEERTTEGKKVYDPEIRHVYENTDTVTEVVQEKVVAVEEQPVVIVSEPQTQTIRYEEYTARGGVTKGGDIVVIQSEGLQVDDANEVTENVVSVSEQVVSEPAVQTTVYKEISATETTPSIDDAKGGDIFVVQSEGLQIANANEVTENVVSVGEQVVSEPVEQSTVYREIATTETTPSINNNSVYYIKAEGVDQDNQVEIISKEEATVVQAQQNEEGLWESYAEKPDAEAGTETIIRDAAYRYHDDDEVQSPTTRMLVQGEKRVHYMEELEQTIQDTHFDDDETRKELEAINGGLEEDDDDDYILDEEALKMFQQAPNIVVIDKEDD